MYRHPLDAISLFFGLVLTAVGAFVVFSDNASHLLVGPWLLPTLFLAGGVVLLAGLIPSRAARPAPAAPSGTAADDTDTAADDTDTAADDTGETQPLEW